jgi:hypothetical protein
LTTSLLRGVVEVVPVFLLHITAAAVALAGSEPELD